MSAREEGQGDALSAEHAYDRQAAVDYSSQWVGERNEEWPDYTRYGGNCQNYLSQCLLAGGIPMDPYGSALWKWYGDSPNNTAGAAGRSASWSSVPSFREYARENSGFGLAAQVDAPYYSGQEGDVLQLGRDGNWRHTVLISQVIQDEEGQTVDYLVNSNTADLLNFPAGAYYYTQQSLIRICGWNNA